MTEPDAHQLPASSTLLYLSADRLPGARAVPGLAGKLLALGSMWVTLPSRHHRVAVSRFGTAGLLLASAFWSLREQGLVELQAPAQERRERWGSATATIRRVRDGTTTGLEGELLDLHDRDGATNVGALCALRLADLKADLRLIEDTDRWLETRGYGAYKTTGMPWNTRDTVELDEDRLAALKPACERVLSSWKAFMQAEPTCTGGWCRRAIAHWPGQLATPDPPCCLCWHAAAQVLSAAAGMQMSCRGPAHHLHVRPLCNGHRGGPGRAPRLASRWPRAAAWPDRQDVQGECSARWSSSPVSSCAHSTLG
jgi:hypothetical protein